MSMIRLPSRRAINLLTTWIVVVGGPLVTHAGPINTNAALTPSKGGNIFRLQYTYSEADGNDNIRHLNGSGLRGTYVYGWQQNLALFLTVPYANRQVDKLVPRLGRIEEAHDGIADITILAKYRFWQLDTGPGWTARWAVLGGLNIRSGDSDFTSDSYDPILGTVFSWRRGRGRFDTDLIYQFNTGRDGFRHDDLRYDVSYSIRLWPAVYEPGNAYEFDAVAELNGRYSTDKAHEVFLSPGLQFITQRWILEASIQLPVIQEFPDNRPETAYRLVCGIRFQW